MQALLNLQYKNMGDVTTGVNTINIPGDKNELFKTLHVTAGTTNVHALRGHEIDIDTLVLDPKSHVVMIANGGTIRVRHLVDNSDGSGLLLHRQEGGQIFVKGFHDATATLLI